MSATLNFYMIRILFNYFSKELNVCSNVQNFEVTNWRGGLEVLSSHDRFITCGYTFLPVSPNGWD